MKSVEHLSAGFFLDYLKQKQKERRRELSFLKKITKCLYIWHRKPADPKLS